MPETRREVKTYLVDYVCDKCHDGFMEQTGKVLCINPPRYTHKCNKCGDKKTFITRYPKQVLEYLWESELLK